MKELKLYPKPGGGFPIENEELSAQFGLKIVRTPGEADWIVVPRFRSVYPYLARHPWKRYLVYTMEPRLSDSCEQQRRAAPLLPPVEVMGVFTGDVFWHNYHYLGSCHFRIDGPLGVDIYHELPMLTARDLGTSPIPVAAFISYRLDVDTTWIIGGVDRDLEVPRSTYAKALQAAGLCDIYGSGWPEGVSKKSSGYGTPLAEQDPWWINKMRDLAPYRYNLCLENSAADYYCTEKIWQAIQAGTLPIYWGPNNKIYEIFPKGSFIDLADFETPEHLIDFIKTLPESDYLARNNACREVFNRSIAYRRDTIAADPALHMERIVARLRR